MSNQIDNRLLEVENTAGIEAHGIERVSPANRTHVRIFDNFTLWLSAKDYGLNNIHIYDTFGFAV